MTNKVKKYQVIVKGDIPKTILQIKEGDTAVFDCRELGRYMSVYSFISRQNQKAGFKAWSMTTTDNGYSYEITHHANA